MSCETVETAGFFCKKTFIFGILKGKKYENHDVKKKISLSNLGDLRLVPYFLVQHSGKRSGDLNNLNFITTDTGAEFT